MKLDQALKSIAGNFFAKILAEEPKPTNCDGNSDRISGIKVHTAASFGPVASSPTPLGELDPCVRPRKGKCPDETTKQDDSFCSPDGSFRIMWG